MSVEAWKSLFDWSAVILLFLTFASTAGSLIAGSVINKQQDIKLRQFDADLVVAKTDLAKQQERAAKAEAKVAQLEIDRARIEQRVSFNGPRGETLKVSRNSIIATLLKFSGQKVSHVVCGGEMKGANADEISVTDNVFALIFRDAKWVLSGSKHTIPADFPGVELLPIIDDSCQSGEGMLVIYRPDAPESTRRAADALAAEIFRVLKVKIEAGPRGDLAVPSDPEMISLFIAAHSVKFDNP